MYGHPAGCSDDFLYKEPYEFVPHVLWLLSDSEDRRACPCKPCHRATGRKVPRSLVERLQAEVAAKQQAAAAAAAAPPPAETKPKKGAGSKTANMATKKKAAAAAAAAEVIGAKASAKDPTAAAKPNKRTTAAPKTTASTPVAAPSPSSSAAPPAAAAQQLLVNNEPTLFRRGEMVWYQQGPAWRIGVIRQVGAAPTHAYTIAPLGHALLLMPDLVKQQQEMRPFLTFSVPGVGLEDIPNTIFSEVPWQELINKHAHRDELVGLEASKMAALEIDSSWSVFNRLAPQPQDPPAQQQQQQPPKNQTRYDGAFLGAEMVRRGDPIRHKDKSKGTLLEVAEIIVTSTTVVPAPGAGSSSSSTTPQPPTRQDFLSFRGVEYEAALVPEPTYVTKQPHGAIFAKDTAFRSAAAKAGGANQKCVWTVRHMNSIFIFLSLLPTGPCFFAVNALYRGGGRKKKTNKFPPNIDQIMGRDVARGRGRRPLVRDGRAHPRDDGRGGGPAGAADGQVHRGAGLPEQPDAEPERAGGPAQQHCAAEPARDGRPGGLAGAAAEARRGHRGGPVGGYFVVLVAVRGDSIKSNRQQKDHQLVFCVPGYLINTTDFQGRSLTNNKRDHGFFLIRHGFGNRVHI